MDFAKKNNTQLICFTGIDSETIHNRFSNIYVLNRVAAGTSNSTYIKGERKSGKDPEILSSTNVWIRDDVEQMTLF